MRSSFEFNQKTAIHLPRTKLKLLGKKPYSSGSEMSRLTAFSEDGKKPGEALMRGKAKLFPKAHCMF